MFLWLERRVFVVTFFGVHAQGSYLTMVRVVTLYTMLLPISGEYAVSHTLFAVCLLPCYFSADPTELDKSEDLEEAKTGCRTLQNQRKSS